MEILNIAADREFNRTLLAEKIINCDAGFGIQVILDKLSRLIEGCTRSSSLGVIRINIPGTKSAENRKPGTVFNFSPFIHPVLMGQVD